MASLKPGFTLKDYRNFVNEIYGPQNNKHYESYEMLNNIQRFALRGIKGIRKRDYEKAKKNLIISFSWFTSVLNRLSIRLEDETWKRFPYICSYCGICPCICRETKPEERVKPEIKEELKPETLKDFQEMFKKIYPPESRNLEHSGIHLAEEVGEFSEAVLNYRTDRNEKDFLKIKEEAADYFSCLIGVFNSINIDLSKELESIFYLNCHECHKSPCECEFKFVGSYVS